MSEKPSLLERMVRRRFAKTIGEPRTDRPSGVLKTLVRQVSGEGYDRSPCPHSLVLWDTVADPQRPDDPHRVRTRRTEVRCERPDGHRHGREALEREHSGASGVTW
jgi:hypothetical protein